MKNTSIPTKAAPQPTLDERLAAIMKAMNDLQAQSDNRRETLIREKLMPRFVEFMNSQPGWKVTGQATQGTQGGAQQAPQAAPEAKQTFTQRMAAAMPQEAIRKVMDLVSKLKGGK